MNSKKMKKWVIYGVIALTILGPQTLIHENIHADESTTTIENGNEQAKKGTIEISIIDSSSGQVLKSFDITDFSNVQLQVHESEIESQIASLKGYILDPSQGSYAPNFVGGETAEAKFYVKRATSGTINVNIIDSSSGQVLKSFDITDVPGHLLKSHESEIETQIASLKGYVLDKSQGSYAPTFIGGETGEAKFYVKRATSGTINVNIIDSSSGQVLKSFDITDVPGHLLKSHESEIETQIASLKGYVLDKSQGSYAPTFIGGETREAKFYVKKDTDGISKINTTDASNAQVPKNSDAKVLNHSSELTESQAQKKSSIDKDIKSQKIIAIEKKSKSLPHTGESTSILSYSLGSLALLGASFFFMIKRFKNL
ncbi:MAG: LPXTG cell wall anchor domain-containing protein [Lactococcus cremoris]